METSQIKTARAAWETSFGKSKIYWEPLAPLGIKTRPKLKTKTADDFSVLVSGDNPKKALYAITAEIDQRTRAFRLEALRHKSLPHGGPGRAGNGNFVVSEFNAANESFDAAGDSKRIGQLKQLSKKYAKLKPVDRQRLTDNQLADLFNESESANQMTLFYLYYHHMQRRPASAKPEEYVALAGAVLDKLNYTRHSQGNPLRLEITSGGNYMNLSDVPYTVYSINIIGVYRRNVLAPLDLDFLDISHSKMEHLYELRGMKLKELHMADVTIGYDAPQSFLNQVKSFNLEKITITVDDFSQETLDALKVKMEVVDADAGRKAEARRQADEVARLKREAELKRKEAEEKKRKEEQARKKAKVEAEKKAEAEAARKKQVAERQQQDEAARKKSKEEARLKKEAELEQQKASAEKAVNTKNVPDGSGVIEPQK